MTLPNDGYWVREGEIMAGPYPGSKLHEEAVRDLGALLDAGARTFIDLTEEGELKPYDAILGDVARKRGITCRHLRFPIPDLGTTDLITMARILITVREAAEAGQTPYIHCWGGVGRTGTIVGCLLREDGVGADQIFEQIRRLRADTIRAERPSPETRPQCELVLEWNGRGETS